MNRATWLVAILAVLAFIVGGALGLFAGMEKEPDPAAAKTETVRESTTLQPINNNKTVPLKETHTENNHYYTQPCNLPDTGPTLRRHKAH